MFDNSGRCFSCKLLFLYKSYFLWCWCRLSLSGFSPNGLTAKMILNEKTQHEHRVGDNLSLDRQDKKSTIEWRDIATAWITSCHCLHIDFLKGNKDFHSMVCRLPLVTINLSQMLRICSNLASQMSKKVIFSPNGRFYSFYHTIPFMVIIVPCKNIVL